MVRGKSQTAYRLLLTGNIGPSLRGLDHSDQSYDIKDQRPESVVSDRGTIDLDTQLTVRQP